MFAEKALKNIFDAINQNFRDNWKRKPLDQLTFTIRKNIPS